MRVKNKLNRYLQFNLFNNKCVMGANASILKVNYEDMQCVCRTATHPCLLINTLPPGMQGCLIQGTMPIEEEEVFMNAMLSEPNGKDREIIVYGKNSNDDTMHKKHQQLMGLGFKNVRVYPGGMFEWLLLQDIYGTASFPTTSKELDLLKYKPPSGRQRLLLH